LPAEPPLEIDQSLEVGTKGGMRELEEVGILRGLKNRLLQHLARFVPGYGMRAFLHRVRGVRIGKGVWIGYDVVVETARPDLVTIEDGASISMRATIIAHFKEFKGVRIGREAFIGPGAIILPNVIIGEGAVVKAGSVVSQSIPPRTIVEGNPAVPVARCDYALNEQISMKEFAKGVKPIRKKS
jgi:serine acetyltransferase